jgi:hypothetical protein
MFRRRSKGGDEGAAGDLRDELLTPAELAGGVDELDKIDEPEEDDDEFEDEESLDPEFSPAELESQAADYLADNDTWMYGPNAAEVVAILDILEDAGPDELGPLATAWRDLPRSDREAARKSVRKILEKDLEAGRYIQMAREAVGTWLAVAAGFPEFVKARPDWAATATQAGEATMDALTAVILVDDLEDGHHETLYAAWNDTMGQDAESGEGPLEAASLEGGDDLEDEAPNTEYGPNTDAVTDFLNRLWLLSPEQVGRLVSSWQGTDRDSLAAAHEALRSLVDGSAASEDGDAGDESAEIDLRDQVKHAQDQLIPWLNGGRIEDTAGFLGQSGRGEPRRMAGPALADAIAALVIGDLLERPDAEALYGPWFNLIGAPPLPEPAPSE